MPLVSHQRVVMASGPMTSSILFYSPLRVDVSFWKRVIKGAVGVKEILHIEVRMRITLLEGEIFLPLQAFEHYRNTCLMMLLEICEA